MDMLTAYPWTTVIAVDLYDRLGRRLFLLADNPKQEIIGAWVEEDATINAEVTIGAFDLYSSLAPIIAVRSKDNKKEEKEKEELPQ